MCPAIPSAVYGANQDKWDEIAYGALSVACRVSDSLKRQAAILSLKRQAMILSLAKDLWKLDRILRDFLKVMYETAANPPKVTEPVTQEQLMASAEILRSIHARIDSNYNRAKSGGLTNHGLLGIVLNSVKLRSEEVLEIADWLSSSSDPDVDNLLNRAIDDLHHGNVHDLPSFK